jgi:hypothetical protein
VQALGRDAAEARVLKSGMTADVARGEYREQSRIRVDEHATERVHTFQGQTGRSIRRAWSGGRNRREDADTTICVLAGAPTSDTATGTPRPAARCPNDGASGRELRRRSSGWQ